MCLACALLLALQASAASPRAKTPVDNPGHHGCLFEVIAAFDFGYYDDSSPTSSLTTATFRIKCTGIGNANATFSAGPSAATGDLQDRRLRGPDGDELRYQLFTNSARTTVWGDGTRDTSAIVVTQNGAFKDVTVYGELFAGQSGEIGVYGDNIVVTVLP
jgi:spore coat protein U-like protein